MRKIILTGILIFTLIIGFVSYKTGLTIPTKVYSYDELKQKQAETTMQLDALTNLKAGTYANTQKSLAQTVKNFKATKTMYDAAMESKTELEQERAIAGTSYDLSYLWVKIGNYATETNCDLTIEVFQNQETAEEENYILCDFKFNIISSYANSIAFMEKLSKDSELNFIPENLKMYSEYRSVKTPTYYDGSFLESNPDNPSKPGTEEVTMLVLVTDFYKTNVPIAKSSLSKVENQLTIEAEEKAALEASQNNTTNTANTTNKTNTTNTTNTANTTN